MSPGKVRLMAKYNPVEFIQEVRQEVSKVTWPTWKEVWITTLMVIIMVSLASVFFLITDQTLGYLVRLVLGGGR
ncbi:preprotein translocase subunit SecE [Hyphomicrobium sp. 1Nfss2.1]